MVTKMSSTVKICNIHISWRSREGEKSKTHHSFVRDRFNETVKNLRESMRTNPRTTNIMRVLIHALRPIVACILQDRRSNFWIAVVVFVISCASCHLRKHFGNGDACLFVDVAADGGPKTVENVHYAADEEHVEEQLSVEGEDVGEGGMCGDEFEESHGPVFVGWRLLLLLLLMLC